MGENSKIEWCHHTANFWIGCTEVSPECDGCYARELAARYGWAEWGNDKPRHETKLTFGKLRSWDRKAQAVGERHRVFVNSLSDIADAFAPQELRDRVVQWAGETPNLDYLLLTKRPQNYNKLLPIITANMWGGTTVGVRKSLARIKHLQDTAFHIKFLSIEPLLEDLGEIDLKGISWVIAGGESGTNARPMHPDWVRSIRDQCQAAGVPFFFKQWGEWKPMGQMTNGESDCYYDPKYGRSRRSEYEDILPQPKPASSMILQLDGSDQGLYFPEGAMTCFKVGKKKAGRLLDGRTWDEFPDGK